MIPLLIRSILLLTIAILYAVYDVFNKRDVPDFFVYACLVLGFIVTFTYDLPTIATSLIIVAIIAGLGYALYRMGILGAGDFLEFITISLILPIQPVAVLSNFNQFSFPFIFSVFIATGYSALIGMAVYYLIVAKREGIFKSAKPAKKNLYSGTVILAGYLLLIGVLNYVVGISLLGSVFIIIVGVASFFVTVFQKAINMAMVSYLYPSELAQGDMIATSLMKRGEFRYFEGKSKSFGRLATKNLIKELRNVKRKLPVYTKGVPLALFVLIGVVVSLFVGNLLIYVIY